MKNFEFPQQKKKVEEVKKEKDTRGPGGGFFAGFNQSSKSKMAEVSKKEKEEQSTKMKQYREIIGVVQGSSGGGGGVSRPQTANKKTVADNRWVVDLALRKVETGKQLMSVEVKRDYDEPKRQPAGVRLDHQNRDPNGRQAVGEPISVK